MNSDYSIEAHETGRFIVWRLHEDKKLRQGSYGTYAEAYTRIEQSREILGDVVL